MTRISRLRQAVTLTADLVILTLRRGELQVLLVERGYEPYVGQRALPGGFLRSGETLDETAARELAEETGMDASALHLEQIGVYSALDRDPREPRVVTCAYLAIAPDLPAPTAGSDARAAHWVPVAEAERTTLAFDHDEILADGLEKARASLQSTTIATAFCDEEFTIGQLCAVYEAVWGVELDKPNFHRKVTDADGFLVPTGAKQERGVAYGRPAALYRAGPATSLMPPMSRPSTTKPSRVLPKSPSKSQSKSRSRRGKA